MPNIDGKDISPDEAMLSGHCPECGQLLIPKTAVAHGSSHWFGKDPNDPSLSEEGRRRYKLIIDFAATRYNPALEERDSHRQGNMSPMQPGPSSHDTRPFWIDQLYAGGIFCAGLTMLPDHLPFGIVLSAIGAVWLGYLRWGRNPVTLQVRMPNVLSVAVLCVATLVMVYDIYDRHLPLDQTAGHTPTKLQIQYNELGNPQPITKLNVANFVSINSISRAMMKDSQGRPVSDQVFTNAVYLFVVFDKPIAVKDFRIDGNGASLPMHEIKDKTPRSALIVFDGPIIGTVVNVEAVF